jgi:hypothetical protein
VKNETTHRKKKRRQQQYRQHNNNNKRCAGEWMESRIEPISDGGAGELLWSPSRPPILLSLVAAAIRSFFFFVQIPSSER